MNASRRSPLRLFCVCALAIASIRAAAQTSPAADTTYVVQRGDEISVKVFSRPELDETVVVRPDGRISAPLVDQIDAAGVTTARLTETLTERYARFFKDPQVTVILRRAAGLQVFVGGEVGQPGVLSLTGSLSAIGAVFQAGGFKRSARTDSVVLLRDVHAAKPLTQRLNLKDLAGKDATTALQPQDVIFVPPSRIAKVDNFVDQYMRQLIPISLTAGFTYLLGGNSVVVGGQ